MMGLGCSAGIIGLAVLVFAVMYVFFIGRMGRLFAEEANVAEQTWARIEAPAPRAPAGAPNVA